MSTYTGMQYEDSTNLQGLREDIYYIGKCNANSISENDLNRIINKYYGQVQEVIKSVNENFYMVQASADLSSTGDGSYTFPDGTGTAPTYEKIKSLWVALQPANVTNPLVTEFSRVNIIDPDSISDPSYSFSQPTASMFGTYFTLTPLPVATVTGGLKIYYVATQNKLVNTTDVPLIFPSFHDAIVHGSLIDVSERLGKSELKKQSAEFFAKRLEDIKAYASDRIPDEVGLVEGQDTSGGWCYPWEQRQAM